MFLHQSFEIIYSQKLSLNSQSHIRSILFYRLVYSLFKYLDLTGTRCSKAEEPNVAQGPQVGAPFTSSTTDLNV